ncbi:MAG: T9SS type A sorting domain-containing protein [Bacteroidetes bacterium]|nr:T9SS type A sorting domain-containing protein [Bacteroidota bacterium]
MYLSSTAPRKSCIWLGSTTIGTAGCALTSLSPGLLSNFGQVPSTLRPNIGFRFRRPQNFMNGLVGSDLNNNAGSKFWSSFANLTITGNMNNTSQVFADTSVITLNGLYNNNGSTDFSYTPLLSNRKTIMNFNGVDWNNNGIFTAGNSLVNFSGALLQNLGGSNVTTFHELKINKTAAALSVTMLKDVIVDDTLSLTQGQLRMNINAITINNGSSVTTGGLLTPVGPITRTSGFIISENANALVNWNNIDIKQGYRVVPFGSEAIAAPVYIPFSFQLNSGDMGDMSISTYKAPGNLPLPPGVSHLNSTTAAVNNAAATVDRFWMLSKTGPNPVSNLVFRFTPTERPLGMSAIIPANQGRAQPWRQQLLNGAWIRLTTPYTTLSYIQNYALTALPSDSVRVVNWDWPSLPAQAAQAFPPLYATPGGPIGNSHPWTVSINSNALPVDLIHFDAEAVASDVRLYWSTASEENSDFFTVERTLNFEDHTVIATVPSAGNSSNLLNYETFDKNPLDGINYYRLLQTDLDGSVNVISDYVPVRFGKSLKFEILNLLHDPSSILVYNYNSNEDLQMLIVDMTGRVIQQRGNIAAQNGLNMLQLDLSSLSSGIYTIQLRNASAAQSYRFMKP